jgi:hypothetical protein
MCNCKKQPEPTPTPEPIKTPEELDTNELQPKPSDTTE